MNPSDEFASILMSRGASSAPVVGRWHNLQLRPDLGSGEVLNIGVAFVDENDRVHLQLAHELPRLACLYDDRVDIQSFEKLCILIQGAYNGRAIEELNLAALSEHTSLSQGRYASGASVREILDRFFEATVPLARAYAPPGRASRARIIATSTARSLVVQSLVDRMGARIAPFISRAPWTVSGEGEIPRRVEIPIRAPGVLSASVVSVWSKNTHQRKLQLASAGIDLEIIKKTAPDERLGLFVMRPNSEPGYSRRDLEAIDSEIDEARWRLKDMASIKIESEDTYEALSERLEEWVAAA